MLGISIVWVVSLRVSWVVQLREMIIAWDNAVL